MPGTTPLSRRNLKSHLSRARHRAPQLGKLKSHLSRAAAAACLLTPLLLSPSLAEPWATCPPVAWLSGRMAALCPGGGEAISVFAAQSGL